GDRIIEIGCVELVNRRLTGNNFHYYVNPERDSDPGALAVHGLTTDFLSDKPKFAEIAKALCDYLRDAEIIIHNAPFDVGFLDAEFEKLGLPKFDQHVRLITDTLLQAKELHPGKRNSLDALCERYGVSNAHRTLHGALLDSELLAEVYLAMTRGQDSLGMDLPVDVADADGSSGSSALAEIMVLSPLPEEIAAHQEMLQALNKESKGACLWLQDGP
ncbi:MAG: DNA polymerase III subunit epsilon, partial [Burkholderiaceae bacterium]